MSVLLSKEHPHSTVLSLIIPALPQNEDNVVFCLLKYIKKQNVMNFFETVWYLLCCLG